MKPLAESCLKGKDTCSIEWNTVGTIEKVNINYSLDNGKIWSKISSNIQNTNIASWVLPDTLSDSVKIRISADVDSTNFITNSGFLHIVNTPKIVLLTPKGGEIYQSNKYLGISWSTAGKVDSVQIALSLDSGVTWQIITQNTPDDGGYVFPLTVSESFNNCFVKISGAKDTSIFDICDSIFHINNSSTSLLDYKKFPKSFNVLVRKTNKDIVLLDLSLPTKEYVTIAFYSLSGRIIFREDIGKLNPGLYALKLNNKGAVFTPGILLVKAGKYSLSKKVIKQ